MADDQVLGIDLGTTNSALAIMRGGDPEIIVNREGERTTPSVVALTNGDTVVGKPAKNQAVQNPDKTVESIKRHMGERDYRVSLAGEEYTPEQISAIILKKIRQDAEDYLGHEINRAVITVPAYFSDRERQATKDAGKIAGFNVERIINEPTAAAMAYGLDDNNDQTILVFDLGGGTFDVSILEIGGGIYEVIATNGNTQLGGDDWDQAIIEKLVKDFHKEHGIDLTNDRQALQRITEAAEEAKIELTSREETTISLPFIIADDDGPKDLNKTITRDLFEDLTRKLVEQTTGPIKRVLEDGGYDSIGEMDKVLLIGGATRMPMIQEHIKKFGATEIAKDINPDEAVALGAAIQGGILSDNVDDVVLFDVTPLSLGVEVKGGVFERIIPRNTTIPFDDSMYFTTAKDNQTQVQIKVYQGEREIAEENELLAEFKLTGIPPAPAGVPKIKVTFEIDENGIVNVEARDTASDTKEEITIEGGVGLSEEEIEQMREEAEEHEEYDEQKKQKIEIENEAEQMINKATRTLKNHKSDIPQDTQESIKEEISETEKALKRSQEKQIEPDDLKSQVQTLSEVMQEFGEEAYNTQSDAALE